jgi:hypothetical protein
MNCAVDTNTPTPVPTPTYLEKQHNVKILWGKQVLWQWINLCTVIILDIVLKYSWYTEHFFCVSAPVFKWLVNSLYSKTIMVVHEILILILIRIVLVSYDFTIGSHGYVNMLKICIVYIFVL